MTDHCEKVSRMSTIFSACAIPLSPGKAQQFG